MSDLNLHLTDASSFKKMFKKDIGIEYPERFLEGKELYSPGDYLICSASVSSHFYLLQSQIDLFLKEAPDGYFVTGYWGHGMNSYAYYLLYVDGCSKVFLRVGFGGVYSNQEHDQQHVRAVFEGFADFLEKIEGKVKCMTIVDSMGVSNFKIITTDGRKIGKFPDQVYSEKKLRLDTGIPFAELTECVLDTKCFDGPEIDGTGSVQYDKR